MAKEKAKKPGGTQPTPEQWLELLRKGVDEFNKFRERHPEWTPHFPKGADLRGADLRGAHLEGASLHQARLQGANLQGACLRGANLRKAEMAETDLRQADLERTALDGAVLRKADVRGADFERAKGLEDADLDALKIDSSTGFWGVDASPIGQRYPLLARAISDAQFIEDFRNQHPVLAWFWWLLADYGRSWRRWACWSLGIAVFFGLLFTLLPGCFELRAGRQVTWFTYFYFSIVTFTTLGFGDVVPKNVLGEILLSVEVVLGYVMLGGLVSMLATKLARRS